MLQPILRSRIIVWVISLLSLFSVACNKDEIKLKDIGSIPVSDAAYIFTRESVRSSSDDDLVGVWKVTKSGDEVKLKVLDNDGNETDIEIFSVENILENYLLVRTEVGGVLVDKTTNKVYKCPDSLFSSTSVEEYPKGTLYYVSYGQMFKSSISSQSITEEQLLPEGQSCTNFFIGQKGCLYYTDGYCYNTGGKVMSKNKHLYPIEKNGACRVFGTSDHGIYTIDHMWYDRNDDDEDDSGSRSTDGPNYSQYPIYKWNPISDDEVKKEFICNITYLPTDFAPINALNNTVLFFVVHHNYLSEIYEFNGSSCVSKKMYTSGEENEALHLFWMGMQKTYPTPKKINSTCTCFEQTGDGSNYVVTFNPKTYEVTKYPYNISSREYEVYDTKYEPSWGKMLFTALRYSDGSIVMGEVDTKGNVSVVSERASTYHITEYFALN